MAEANVALNVHSTRLQARLNNNSTPCGRLTRSASVMVHVMGLSCRLLSLLSLIFCACAVGLSWQLHPVVSREFRTIVICTAADVVLGDPRDELGELQWRRMTMICLSCLPAGMVDVGQPASTSTSTAHMQKSRQAPWCRICTL
jgi:hypothetical protein